ncbi:MAG: hypothetical protein GX051_08820 [Clostridiales bacterium]|nr:hypothetical protein [Clostridiales bacterium]
MQALSLVSTGLRKTFTALGARKCKTNPITPIVPSEFDYISEPKSEYFIAGFGKTPVLPKDLDKKKYYIAGYNSNNPALGVLDTPYAHAVWLDDNSGRGGVVFVSVDDVGMLSADVNAIRDSMSEFVKETGCRSINILSTHSHAGIDTMGIWGPLPISGRDKHYMEIVAAGIRSAVKKAYLDRREGSLYLGETEVPDMQEDIRLPVVYSKILTRLRFVPNDGTREIYMLNFASHSESLSGSNSFVSADFPCYMREKIMKETGAETIYFVGAIGGMISMELLHHDKITSTKMIGRKLADYALSIKDEKKLSAKLNLIRQEFFFQADNSVLMAAAKAKILNVVEYGDKSAPLNFALKSEMTYLELDSLKMLLLPCELFPELAFGGYLSEAESAQGKSSDMNPTPLCEIAEDEKLLIFGLANDEVGYVIPPNDFMLNSEIPYLDKCIDRLGRRHYEETNSLGPDTAPKIAEVFSGMMNTVKNIKNKKG